MSTAEDIKRRFDESAKQEAASTSDFVNHPKHYGGEDNPYEAIKVIEAWGLGFCLGNVVKYISRCGKKGNRIEDLKKSRWYLDREIKRLEGVFKNGESNN